MPFEPPTSLRSPTGAELRLFSRPAEGRPRAVVQINHGLAEHAARYGRFADALAARGFHVYAHDHRGHGGTHAPDAPPRSFGAGRASDKVIADVAAVHDRIARLNRGLPVIVFGHSMGGLIALGFALRHPRRAHALAVWNANVSAGPAGHLARGLLAWERMRLGSDAPSRLLPRLTFQAWARTVPRARTAFDWLSRDGAEVDRYVADPHCGWDASVGMWQAVFDLIAFGAADANYKALPRAMPIQLVGGAHDPATAGGKAVERLAARLRAMGFSNLQSRVYAETRHESLNEVNRDLITRDFTDWAERAIA
ncbi:alpha/beta hydrolase [Aquibium sp. A9E412]|uniref:alpha/beta fold hydrolase n=1 Tax=Aquibium sp. A9E412 TaxID=2976767 RepID=UPI0025B03873|nr:alpha/beta hydrolase [Aquibium sp. A9E412]MDN2566590.1 alpha/beta hydrolase [Aquibium sp. A9E412]